GGADRSAVRSGGRAAPGRRGDRRLVRGEVAMTWAALLVAAGVCYAIKLAGLSLPQRFLKDPRIQRTVPLLPVALLAALIATQTFASGQHLVLDVRAPALEWLRSRCCY